MLFKLSARNVKRSFKDYAIYFLTLTFAVCIFYSFNSISASAAMSSLSASQSEMIQSITQLISIVSVFVSIVLGFLILFANNFLIRRRKKELGIYMTLGMSKYSISLIVVMETLFIGVLSLMAGLLLGIFISQGLSVLVVSLFKADMTKFEVVFSSEAMFKTMSYFGIIFLFVMIFNSLVISKYKLIDLLTAARKNESLKIRKISTSIAFFVLSFITLGIAYTVILKYGLTESLTVTWTCVGLGSLGTFLFFMSLSGFALNMLQRNNTIYFKGLNMFVLRQISSKVNTTFVSMTIICLMLFFTIGVLSTGFSIKAAGEKQLVNQVPYDATFYLYGKEDTQIKNIDQAIEILGMDLDEMGENSSFELYEADSTYNELLRPFANAELEQYFDMAISRKKILLMKESDYVKLLQMQDVEPKTFNKGEVLLISDDETYFDAVNAYIKENQSIHLNAMDYTIVNRQVEYVQYINDYPGRVAFTVIVPDQAIEGMTPNMSLSNVNYSSNSQVNEDELYHLTQNEEVYSKYGFYVNVMTKQMLYDQSIGSSTMIVFMGIYLGIVFLISSAAVLALQQLSEASDNMERYSMLRKIGVTSKEINKAIFGQVFIYFMMPLSLAIIHSIFGIKVVNQELLMMGQPSVFIPALFTALIMIIVYGGYFIATYSGYKRIVKN
ncbi:ABC transporter permease [Bacillus sp. E214]|uniref:ABC transporter permease n=1 Tax=Bacillus sp. E214 TaxID=2587156 RepID=UPI0011DF647E|nr:ABC transporter permease [Bacillus sp. E214]